MNAACYHFIIIFAYLISTLLNNYEKLTQTEVTRLDGNPFYKKSFGGTNFDY